MWHSDVTSQHQDGLSYEVIYELKTRAPQENVNSCLIVFLSDIYSLQHQPNCRLLFIVTELELHLAKLAYIMRESKSFGVGTKDFKISASQSDPSDVISWCIFLCDVQLNLWVFYCVFRCWRLPLPPQRVSCHSWEPAYMAHRVRSTHTQVPRIKSSGRVNGHVNTLFSLMSSVKMSLSAVRSEKWNKTSTTSASLSAHLQFLFFF